MSNIPCPMEDSGAFDCAFDMSVKMSKEDRKGFRIQVGNWDATYEHKGDTCTLTAKHGRSYSCIYFDYSDLIDLKEAIIALEEQRALLS